MTREARRRNGGGVVRLQRKTLADTAVERQSVAANLGLNTVAEEPTETDQSHSDS
jgi:hypothetical protein